MEMVEWVMKEEEMREVGNEEGGDRDGEGDNKEKK